MSAITTRLATANDVEAIAAVTRQAYAKWVAVIGREPLPMRVDYAEAVGKHRFDLLHVDDDLAALIETTPDEDHLLIVNLAVAPAFQGRGLGVRLLKAAEDLAEASGLKGTRLYTNARFAENLRLYAALGYRIDREEALNGGVAVYMSKALSSPSPSGSAF